MKNTNLLGSITKIFCTLLICLAVLGGVGFAVYKITDPKTENGVISTDFYEGKTLVSYGDSLTARPYPTLVEGVANGSWQKLVVEDLGFEKHFNLGIGSTTMATSRANGMTSFTRIQAIKNANPDVITIWAGANDVVITDTVGTDAEFDKILTEKDQNTFTGAYSYLVETLLDWKPNLQILILVHFDTEFNNEYGGKNEQIRQATISVAKHYSLDYVDLNDIGITANNIGAMTNDGIHIENTPTIEIVANLVTQSLKNKKI